MRYHKFKKTLIALVTMTLCGTSFSESSENRENPQNRENSQSESTTLDQATIQGCSTKGGLHLALATGDFWCEPDKPDPFPCGGYYLGFPDTEHTPPDNFTPPVQCTCFVEPNVRPGGDYIKPTTTDENHAPMSVFDASNEVVVPLNCQVALHTVHVKDLKNSSVTIFKFHSVIDTCPENPPVSTTATTSVTNSDGSVTTTTTVTTTISKTPPATGVTVPAPTASCGSPVYVAPTPITDVVTSVTTTTTTPPNTPCVSVFACEGKDNVKRDCKTNNIITTQTNAPVCSTDINGLCGDADNSEFAVAPTVDLCLKGTPTPVQTTTTTPVKFTWDCTGTGTGTTASCSAKKAINIDGKCGTAINFEYTVAPVTNLCLKGTPTPVQTNETNFTWTCEGIGTGTDILCSADKKPKCKENYQAFEWETCKGTIDVSDSDPGYTYVLNSDATSVGKGSYSWTCGADGNWIDNGGTCKETLPSCLASEVFNPVTKVCEKAGCSEGQIFYSVTLPATANNDDYYYNESSDGVLGSFKFTIWCRNGSWDVGSGMGSYGDNGYSCIEKMIFGMSLNNTVFPNYTSYQSYMKKLDAANIENRAYGREGNIPHSAEYRAACITIDPEGGYDINNCISACSHDTSR